MCQKSQIEKNSKYKQDENTKNTIPPSEESNIQNFTDTIFTTTNFIILVGFLGAYGIVYY